MNISTSSLAENSLHNSVIKLVGSTGNNVDVKNHLGTVSFKPDQNTPEGYLAVIAEMCEGRKILHEMTEYRGNYIFFEGYAEEKGLEIYTKTPPPHITLVTKAGNNYDHLYHIGSRTSKSYDDKIITGSVIFGGDFLFEILSKVCILEK